MKAKPKRALEECIEHWVVDIFINGELPTGVNCALCRLYNRTDDCSIECPIREYTGRNYCCGTPYQRIITLKSKEARRAEALRMVEFMEFLLDL